MPTQSKLFQCTRCGVLKGGYIKEENLRRCVQNEKHRFKALTVAMVASALGSAGGGTKVYATEKERREARLATFIRSNNKRRGKTTEPAPESAP